MMLNKCPECGTELTQEMIDVNMCWECGFIIDKSLLEEDTLDEINEQEEENSTYLSEAIASHKMTTSGSFEGYVIKEYKGLVSGEMVLGTGFISDFKASFSDLFGIESKTYSAKIKEAKRSAVYDMIKESLSVDGNAIIGITYQISALAGSNMVMVSVNGTSVFIEKCTI